MRDPMKLCLTEAAPNARIVHVVPEGGDLETLGRGHLAYLRERGFKARPGCLAQVPGPQGIASAILIVKKDETGNPLAFGALPTRLGQGDWALDFSACPSAQRAALAEDAVLGFCMGAYRFRIGKEHEFPVRLVLPEEARNALPLARANWLGRDLINTPANLLGPSELAAQAKAALEAHGATVDLLSGASLQANYPCLAAVGAGSDRAPRVVVARWQGSGAGANSPLISLVGKGVCFDTGGYDIKSSAGMLRMKKDMGGAALMLAVALVAMARDLPLRLELRLGCVENSISGHAMRPGDVLKTRAGLSVEIGNTDAEGRLVLCDLLAEACEADPAWLIDAATLTGAARVALGPDLPALFSNDDELAQTLLDAAETAHDAMWRLPLWYGYDAWLDRKTADIGNVSDKPMAGAITAALFLQRFVKPQVKWAHIDTYAWNDSSTPGRPEGGDTLALRGISTALLRMIN
ncbi:leucyl aminopeptidase family protein [Kozakia baliensis]|uniref:leucyl aminopeptidase family protein n=1 Tax=Kozakia baliensis TaxID=153496 RepID=UPI000689AFF2|nr:leucyl aminopeptidase family protein [Kozakia baliensis]